MDDLITEIALDGGLDSIRALLDDAVEGSSRVVVIDATRAGEPSGRLTASELRHLTLFELPVVFAFEGDITTALADVALTSDIRVCSAAASLIGPLAGNARARTLCDEARALDLFIGRRALPAAELLAAGLVSSVTENGYALEEARRLAGVIASRGPIATRLAKEGIWRGLPQPIDQALRFETDLTLLLQTTKDRAEGVRAFLEKRTPKFTGE
ncbi:MAG: enoyl-CoA hydratase-related protein [Dehalococcoidia bacterium]